MANQDSELIINDKGGIYHLGLKPKQLASNIIVVGDRDRVNDFKKYLDFTDSVIEEREFRTLTGAYRGVPISVIGTGIGTDNNEITFVECYALHAIDFITRKIKKSKPLTIIRVGTCGGVQKDIPPGTLAISNYAIGLDSTGLYYETPLDDNLGLKIEQEARSLIHEITPNTSRFKGIIPCYVSKANPIVVKALKENAKANYEVGITCTASGFYGCQGRIIPGLNITIKDLHDRIAEFSVEGNRIINFEMESSLLFHLAKQRHYKCGTVCAILANRPRKTFIKSDEHHQAVDNAIRTGLDALVYLNRSRNQ